MTAPDEELLGQSRPEQTGPGRTRTDQAGREQTGRRQASGETAQAGRLRLVRPTLVFTLLYAGVHVYWAVGGTWGVPIAALQDPGMVKMANWVVSAVMFIGAAWVLSLDHRFARRVPAWVVLVPVWIGGVVCASHAVFGFVTKTLYLAGVHGAVDFPEVTGVDRATLAHDHHVSAVLDLWFFEPCFLVQGLLLVLVGRQFIRTPAGRRKWTLSVLLGVALIDVLGLLLSLADLHVAVG